MGDSNINLELIKISKEMLVDQYIDKKTQNHNKWIVESDYWWKLNKTILEYPLFPPYPTEKEIIEKAKILASFVKVEPVHNELPTVEIAPIEINKEIENKPTEPTQSPNLTKVEPISPSSSLFGFLYRFRKKQ
jgi:hypothetical protein